MRCSRRCFSRKRPSLSKKSRRSRSSSRIGAMARAHLLLRRDVVRAREDGVRGRASPFTLPRSGSTSLDRLDRVAEELDADRGLLLVGGEDLDHVAAHAERAAVEVDVVALVLDVDEHAQAGRRARNSSPTFEIDEQAVVALGRADAVDAAHARDDDDVAPRRAARASPRGACGRSASLMIASLSMYVSLDGT